MQHMEVMSGCLFRETVFVVVVLVEQALSALQQWSFELVDMSPMSLVAVCAVRYHRLSTAVSGS